LAFADEEEKKAHLRAKPRCEWRDPPLELEPRFITQDKFKELKRRIKNVSDEDRWNKMYHIIFPGQNLPSPCKSDIPTPPTACLPHPAVAAISRGCNSQLLGTDPHVPEHRPAFLILEDDPFVAAHVRSCGSKSLTRA